MEDRETIGISLLNLAMVSIGRGSAEGAPLMLLDVLAIAEEIGSKRTGGSLLEVAAGLAASSDECERVALSSELQRRRPHRRAFTATLRTRRSWRRVWRGRGKLSAKAAFAAAEAAGRALSYDGADGRGARPGSRRLRRCGLRVQQGNTKPGATHGLAGFVPASNRCSGRTQRRIRYDRAAAFVNRDDRVGRSRSACLVRARNSVWDTLAIARYRRILAVAFTYACLGKRCN